MGILTDPNSKGRTKLAVLLTKYYKPLSWLAYLSGLVFLLVLPHPLYNAKTYFSENALLPGLVTSSYNEDRAAMRYHTDLVEENKKYPGHAPFPWLVAQFKQLGLEVYQQQFSLTYPLANNSFTGTNVYAILRAPKASSTEALVLAAPHRPPNSPHQSTDAGIAVLLSAAKFFRSQIYWAKDIIFLVTEHEFLGMQAWLEGYHGVSYGEGVLMAGELPARAGSIQAAVNLELSSEFPTHLNVKIEGLNGQLPNLDLVNLVNRLALREGMHQMFQGVEDHSRPDSYTGYMRSLKTMLNMMASQATGVPSGNHGLFHRFGIEAVTLEGVTVRSKRRAPADFHTLGRIVEGTFRSLNNLLERFHQSFFFYILTSGSRYVSIGLYMPMFGLLAGGFVFTAVGIWFKLISAEDAKEGLKDENGEKIHKLPVVIPPHVTKVFPLLIACHCLGLLASVLPPKAADVGAAMSLSPEESIPLSLAAFTLLLLLLPVISRPRLAVPQSCSSLCQCLVCLELSALAGCTSLSNISLAVLVTIPYLPLAIAVRPSKGIVRVLMATYAILCNPLVLSGILTVIDTYRTFPGISWDVVLLRAMQAWQSAVMFSVVDSYIYGNVLYSMATVFLLPLWIVLYLIVFSEEEPSSEIVDVEEKIKKMQ
eukprot:GFUD01087632.1.p1 GENE.GFUD01087632.1~~GFUD01087632.1.p1  ORF type:complete len:650 (-),score=226.04 GFUD01087632.1:40-1989(-)